MSEPRGATSAQPEAPRAHRERTPWWIWVLLLVAAVIVIGGVTQFFVTVDPPEDRFRIHNRTDETVYLFYLRFDGSEEAYLPVPEVQAHSSTDVYEACGSRGFVARTEDGELVSRRGPFEECNLDDWIIEATGG